MRSLYGILGISFLFLFSENALGLFCYSGWQNFSEEPPVDNVSLVECLPHHECCSVVSSLNGAHYDCYEECPDSSFHKCGPDPKLGIQDLHYCYCANETDPDCRPYLGEKTTV
ncbi:unnamed protein product, partial [Mesorhabditis belari]|uniref:Uncharacterized protein n=1 Tax=Mesorhabditis belari TaxID=2138241 RepID=A0AAF3FHV0_9BILA